MFLKHPAFVAPVNSSDEYSEAPTHCAFEAHPFVVFLLAFHVYLTRLLMKMLPALTEARFWFPEVEWLTIIEDEDLLDEGSAKLAEIGGMIDREKLKSLFRLEEDGLRGDEIQVLALGYFRLLCYNKHSGAEYYSDEIHARELLCGLSDYWIAAAKKYTFRFEWNLGRKPQWSLKKGETNTQAVSDVMGMVNQLDVTHPEKYACVDA